VLEDYRVLLGGGSGRQSDGLTEREREVLQLVAEGKTNQEIAEQLTVSIKTVQTHRAHLMRKINAHDRTELVKYAIRQGVVPAE
jgi:DNA-binding NarL/FixJ family response regulator